MVVVVDVPGRQGRCTFVLAVVGPGVEDLFGHDPLVALDLAVVLGFERPGPAVLGAGGDDAGEGGRAVAGPVVGDHPVDAGDAVGGQEHLRAGEEGGRSDALLVGKVLGVGQAGEPVHGGVEVDVASRCPGVLGPLCGAGGLGVAAVDAPSAALGDASDLLHVQVDHVARPVGDDTARGAVGRACGVDEPAPSESEAGQVAGDGPPVEHGAAGGEFGGDAGGGPLVLAPPGLDRGDGL